MKIKNKFSFIVTVFIFSLSVVMNVAACVQTATEQWIIYASEFRMNTYFSTALAFFTVFVYTSDRFEKLCKKILSLLGVTLLSLMYNFVFNIISAFVNPLLNLTFRQYIYLCKLDISYVFPPSMYLIAALVLFGGIVYIAVGKEIKKLIKFFDFDIVFCGQCRLLEILKNEEEDSPRIVDICKRILSLYDYKNKISEEEAEFVKKKLISQVYCDFLSDVLVYCGVYIPEEKGVQLANELGIKDYVEDDFKCHYENILEEEL